MKRNMFRTVLAGIVLVAGSLLPLGVMADTGISVSSTPNAIDMGTQFNGTKLQLKGEIPAGSDVIIRFTGEPKEQHLLEKGKVFGLLWMNVGKVVVDNVPSVCIVDTSRSFNELGKAAEPFSLEGVAEGVQVTQEGKAPDMDVPEELLKLKMGEELYTQRESGITLGADEQANRSFSTTLDLPSKLSPGNYLVQVIAVKDGQIIGQSTENIKAELVGFPKWLSDLAFHQSLLYGIMATVIALVSGLVIGLIFQSKGAH